MPLCLNTARVSDGAVSQLSIDQVLSGIPVGMLIGDGEKALERIFLVLTKTNVRCNGLSLASGEDKRADN